MISWITDNVITPLGTTTQQNYQAVKAGCSALCRYNGKWGIPEPFSAALFTDEQNAGMVVEGLTRFESLAYNSAERAVMEAGVEVTSDRVVFILSTTKANIDTRSPSIAAQRIAARLGVTTQPIVVSNACISGVSAIVLALRLLNSGVYDYAIVCGADIQNKFTVSGFHSLKALSAEPCRPFDIERTGLSLGEAAATVVFKTVKGPGSSVEEGGQYYVTAGAIRNDAFHITSPSKDGEGSRQVLASVMEECDTSQIAFINAHGTATMFNDQMESKAIERAGLNNVPVNGLKGFFGHTLGAAGILETVISLHAIKDNTILATKGFEERGVSGKIVVTHENMPTEKQGFIKMISGFGGCNGAVLVGVEREKATGKGVVRNEELMRKTHTVYINPTQVIVDGKALPHKEQGRALLVELYRNHVGNYPKFYKMDALSRLGFVASELLLSHDVAGTEDTAVILFNHSSSVQADNAYLETIKDDAYFPSPSIFIYTLPNIVTGEIAIRHNYHSETSFYILDSRNDAIAEKIVSASFADCATKRVLCGWLDYLDDNNYEAELQLIQRY